jgi:hypothetical protein
MYSVDCPGIGAGKLKREEDLGQIARNQLYPLHLIQPHPLVHISMQLSDELAA